MKLLLLIFTQTPTPPPFQLDGAISYGLLSSIVIVVAIFALVVIGGSVIIITLLGKK